MGQSYSYSHFREQWYNCTEGLQRTIPGYIRGMGMFRFIVGESQNYRQLKRDFYNAKYWITLAFAESAVNRMKLTMACWFGKTLCYIINTAIRLSSEESKT